MSIVIIGLIASIVAGLLQISGYLSYSWKIIKGKIVPNSASWTIWASGAVLETMSYVFVSGDWVKNILPIACSVSAVLIFLLCLYKGRFEKIDRFDWTIVILDVGISIYWLLSAETFIANVLYVSTSVTSFIPIFRHIWRNPFSENATPWVLWTAAYAMMTVTVIVRYEKWEDLFYPIVLFALHLVVAILSTDAIANRSIIIKKSDIRETAIDEI